MGQGGQGLGRACRVIARVTAAVAARGLRRGTGGACDSNFSHFKESST